jgi:aromatic-L-amino-acid decarboxylase
MLGRMDAATFRKLGHELIEWVADYRERVETLPVMSPVKPGEIRSRFPSEPPRAGGGLAAALKRLDEDVVRGITHWNHPSFFAYFPGNTSYASILADIVASGIGAQGMSWQTSPAATEVEEVMMDWLRQMVGLSDAWTGVVHDTASTATL